MRVEDTPGFPVGSRWYWLGHHWLVEGYSTRDAEPSVVLTLASKGKRNKTRFNVIARLFERKAVPS
jgi:hypothetical protein